MPIGAAAGTPQYSGNYIPHIYSDLLLVALYEATCLFEVANSNWEGEIKKKGDTVYIRTLPDATIRDRIKNQKLVIENLESPKVELTIDHEKYFAFNIDRVDEYQSDIALGSKWTDHNTKRVTIAIEKDVFGNIYADVDSNNAGLTAGKDTGAYNLGTTGTPMVVTQANAYEKLVDADSVLSEQLAPTDGRWAAIPVPYANRLSKSDLKDRNIFGDGTPIAKNGWLGRTKVTGMDVYRVDTLTSVTDSGYTCFHVLFGQKEGLTFASQFNEADTVKPAEYRGTVYRAFNDYGYEVIIDDLVGDLYCAFINE